MNRLILLELKRNGLKSYHFAVVIITVIMLSFLYLLAAIPKLDPTETDLNMFMTYHNLINLNNILCMVIFTIFSSVMYSRFVVEEYAGKRAMLLFSYPIDRKKILEAKICMVFSYTVIAMLLCGALVLGIFFTTESQFPLCADQMSIKTVIDGFLSLLCYSLLAGVWGIVALNFGFGKQSVSVTIIAAVIIATVMCQMMAITINISGAIVSLVIGAIAAAITLSNLKKRVMNMEV
ncbi:conserved membrane hypothetical protein [uncultured Eubacteriales bacterium]|uniref:ABC-type transport system involved in multi-copper enzyme maturation, permease component n=1 Tax=uncultured Eubacteriales bacterium TaxID=172733 RepID=A0A212JNK4_9FIRM|nr:conserved membrane hypothetical protein [uncultured Eubacteriales bacterium]